MCAGAVRIEIKAFVVLVACGQSLRDGSKDSSNVLFPPQGAHAIMSAVSVVLLVISESWQQSIESFNSQNPWDIVWEHGIVNGV